MRIASTAFVFTFVALLVFSIVGASTILKAAELTLAADSLNHHYEDVERDLWKEASLIRSRSLAAADSDWYANFTAERSAERSIESSLITIIDIGNVSDQRVGRAMLVEYGRYTDVLRTLFAEIDASSPDTVRTYKASLILFDLMQGQISERVREQQRISGSSLLRLEKTLRYVVRTMLGGAILGAMLLAASGLLILRYRHVIEVARRAEFGRLATASLTDTLTGLGNHRAYNQELERHLAQARRQDGCVTLALIDVDDFKSVNDTKGHIHGDEVLAGLAKLMCGRRADRGFRLGGDEFAVIFAQSSDDVIAAMERLRHDVVLTLDGISISVGISSVQGADLDARTLRSQADAALYAAKHRGRNGVIAYEGFRAPAGTPQVRSGAQPLGSWCAQSASDVWSADDGKGLESILG